MADLSNVDYDALRPLGVYRQRQREGWVFVRFRVPLGRIEASQLEALARGARAEGRGWVHLTTRQDVEVHWVQVERLEALRALVAESGLKSDGTCGNTVRNVVTHLEGGPLAGEVEALGQFLSGRLGGNPDYMDLPRKFKMAVVESHSGGALINDIGLLPRRKGRWVRWEIYVGGGLGRDPQLAWKLPVEVPTERVYGLVLAILQVFREHGEPKKRLKYLIQRIGFPRFWSLVEEAWDKKADGPEGAASPVAGESLELRAPAGNLTAEQLEGLARLARAHSGGVLYLTQRQNVFFRGLTPAAKEALGQEGRLLGLGGEDFLDVVSCPGEALCARALVNTELEEALRSHFASRPELWEALRQLRINVAGCPNSCSHPQIYDIGLVGAVRKEDGARGYQLLLGGGLAGSAPGFGEAAIPFLTPAEVPGAVEKLLDRWIAKRRAGESFRGAYLRLGPKEYGLA